MDDDPITAFLEARALATPGPVAAEGDPLVEPNYQTTIYLLAEGQTFWDAKRLTPPPLAEMDVDRPRSWDDAHFMEAAYDPALITAIEALRARVTDLEEQALMNMRPFLGD